MTIVILTRCSPSSAPSPTAAMKSLAAIVVAIVVMRAELVRMQQERDESFRAFAARVRGKADTCAYITKCTCLCEVDFTNSITMDVLIACIAAMPAIPSPVPSTPLESIFADFFLTLVAVTILRLETDYPDGSRYSKLLMGQHKPVPRA